MAFPEESFNFSFTNIECGALFKNICVLIKTFLVILVNDSITRVPAKSSVQKKK